MCVLLLQELLIENDGQGQPSTKPMLTTLPKAEVPPAPIDAKPTPAEGPPEPNDAAPDKKRRKVVAAAAEVDKGNGAAAAENFVVGVGGHY